MAVDYATLKKGGFMRQKQKNNFSLRLRVVGGNLTAKQLAKIAEVSENYGDGYVHLTSRQSVEIPFVKLDDVEAVKDALAEGDVIETRFAHGSALSVVQAADKPSKDKGVAAGGKHP